MIAATGPGQAPDVTRTCQPTITGVVDAVEAAWTAIRTRHPELPAVVAIIASGSPAKAGQPMKWGHFATRRWQAGTDRHPELLVSGEGLNRSAAEVFTTLLHEAAHGLADARGIKDTSRQGRWHNKKFADLATELGMTTTKDDKLGFSPCQLTEITAARYRATIDTLSQALTLYRHPETFDTKERTNNNNGQAVECECPRKLRVSNTVFEAGPIWCPLCGEYFLPDDTPRDDFNRDHPLTITQVSGTTPDEEHDDTVFYDPTGARYGLPTYPYRHAPEGLATVRQLRAQGLRPGGQHIAAQILWRQGSRKANLYRIDQALPKRTATPAQRAAIERALTARRTCSTCGHTKPYYIPRRTGQCHDCAPGGTR